MELKTKQNEQLIEENKQLIDNENNLNKEKAQLL